jgi:hypothetical protein
MTRPPFEAAIEFLECYAHGYPIQIGQYEAIQKCVADMRAEIARLKAEPERCSDANPCSNPDCIYFEAEPAPSPEVGAAPGWTTRQPNELAHDVVMGCLHPSQDGACESCIRELLEGLERTR